MCFHFIFGNAYKKITGIKKITIDFVALLAMVNVQIGPAGKSKCFLLFERPYTNKYYVKQTYAKLATRFAISYIILRVF